MTQSVLVIDDDANLLSAMKRQFRESLDVCTAQGGEEALKLVRSRAVQPAVIVCDMRMAGMDGVKTLAALREIAPDATRLMLTGNADLETAVDAINDGHIFRFLTKPCSAEKLRAAIGAALEQHRLVHAEHDLLEKTLAGSVKVLTDILAIAMPDAFSRANRVAGWVQTLVKCGAIEPRWQLNLAALLAPLGLVSLPPEILAKMHQRIRLSEAEAALVQRAPESARRLIANIPRLKPVAEIVYLQNRGFDGTGFPEDGPSGSAIPTDARLLHILISLAAVSTGLAPTPADFALLCSHAVCYDLDLLERVRGALEASGPRRPPVSLDTSHLQPGMYLAEPIRNQHGNLLLASGIQISMTHVERLRHLARAGQIKDKVSVAAAADGRPQR